MAELRSGYCPRCAVYVAEAKEWVLLNMTVLGCPECGTSLVEPSTVRMGALEDTTIAFDTAKNEVEDVVAVAHRMLQDLREHQACYSLEIVPSPTATADGVQGIQTAEVRVDLQHPAVDVTVIYDGNEPDEERLYGGLLLLHVTVDVVSASQLRVLAIQDVHVDARRIDNIAAINLSITPVYYKPVRHDLDVTTANRPKITDDAFVSDIPHTFWDCDCDCYGCTSIDCDGFNHP